MAVIEDSSVHRKKSRDDLDEIPTFNVENMQNNTRIINYSRTFMSIIGGVVAGILGFTGLMGFILYFHHGNYYSRTCCEAWVFSSYFDSWNQIILDGILGGLMDEGCCSAEGACNDTCTVFTNVPQTRNTQL